MYQGFVKGREFLYYLSKSFFVKHNDMYKEKYIASDFVTLEQHQ